MYVYTYVQCTYINASAFYEAVTVTRTYFAFVMSNIHYDQ